MFHHLLRSLFCLVVFGCFFVVIQATLEAISTNSSTECCNTCIGKTSSVPYNYDPLIFKDCSKVTGGICCFECGNLGDPVFGDSVSFGNDGVMAVVKAGSYISITWSDVENITYVQLKAGQKKTTTPTSSDTAAEKKSHNFLICAKSVGTIHFRGWGTNPCREASQEYVVTVEANESTDDTCEASKLVELNLTPKSSQGSSNAGSSLMDADETIEGCNDQRASVQIVDGVRTCVCVSDWTNPPECDRWPVWKWIVTIAGGLATLFSIALSIRAFAQNKKKKQEEQDNYQMHLAPKKYDVGFKENLAPMGTKSDVGPHDMTHGSEFHNTATTPSKSMGRTPGGTQRLDERLFSL